ncbi:unnamed protein product [Ectocarpus sp. 8 AP-2014]
MVGVVRELPVPMTEARAWVGGWVKGEVVVTESSVLVRGWARGEVVAADRQGREMR